MSAGFVRTLCTAAVAAVVAASPALAGPPPGRVPAQPASSPAAPREPAGGKTADEEPPGGSAEDEGAAENGGAPAAGGSPAAGKGAPQSVSVLLGRLQTLYRKTAEAGQSYNGTAEALRKKTAEARKLDAQLTRARAELAAARGDAGRLARDQYQGRTGFSVYLHLLLARNPQSALDQSHVLTRLQEGRAATVERLGSAEERAAALAAKSRTVLERQRALVRKRKEQRDTVHARLREVEAMLASLSGEQLARLTELERRTTEAAQEKLVASGALSSTRLPSAQGSAAVRYAVEQIGKPYVWGAEGPESFDCSGLTSAAWSKAGRAVPRTSQEQWRRLPRVPVSSLRPGDLVVYFPEATHVALYIGDGLVVQAPRPGATVKVSPLASNPLLGAVRPDPGSPSLASYTPPELPQGASDGDDTGYDAPAAG
ncbi:C40 family peptidase [Streptomyces nitrosporeus]|uniref:C40 family peptidase n=1 Tax=Streptomyces nitrosporeus TaxID=28894 RepID=UPI00331FADD5